MHFSGTEHFVEVLTSILCNIYNTMNVSASYSITYTLDIKCNSRFKLYCLKNHTSINLLLYYKIHSVSWSIGQSARQPTSERLSVFFLPH